MLYHSKRQDKMHYNMFITAACLLFLIKLNMLKRPKNKSIYEMEIGMLRQC